MDLTYEEFQRFKTRFPWTAWPDEDFRVPFEVGGPDGQPAWTAYVDGDQMVAAYDWIRQARSQPTLQMVPGAAEPAEQREPAAPPAKKAA